MADANFGCNFISGDPSFDSDMPIYLLPDLSFDDSAESSQAYS
jgi:hypothetical protein